MAKKAGVFEEIPSGHRETGTDPDVFPSHPWPWIPPPGDLPDPGIKPTSLTSPSLAGRFFTTQPPGKPLLNNASSANYMLNICDSSEI